ncbi:hypothetical protein LJR084_003458 [Variovorax sp. LjRoot84]|uniref:hypothetical protein n=1 Tax=Variovorax sp. LjRoot84 TaxID=3342340 RepID=UPI003ECC6EAE
MTSFAGITAKHYRNSQSVSIPAYLVEQATMEVIASGGEGSVRIVASLAALSSSLPADMVKVLEKHRSIKVSLKEASSAEMVKHIVSLFNSGIACRSHPLQACQHLPRLACQRQASISRFHSSCTTPQQRHAGALLKRGHPFADGGRNSRFAFGAANATSR